jgi:hypothetical protein
MILTLKIFKQKSNKKKNSNYKKKDPTNKLEVPSILQIIILYK